MCSEYFVVLGAPASMDSLALALREACQSLELEPLLDGQLRETLADAANMFYFGLRIDGAPPSGRRGNAGLVSRRHTPTALLRRLVALTAARFGAVHLLVHHGRIDGEEQRGPCRSASTTLSGFLRSGRVVQEDVLLSVRLTEARRPRLTRRFQDPASK